MPVVDEAHRESAESIRSLLAEAKVAPRDFRSALSSVPPLQRDAWLDLVFGLDSIPDDDPALPRGCVPYLPCSVDTILRLVEHANVRESDVFVDIGAGVGRAAALVHLLTGAAAIALEIQPGLVRAARELIARLNVQHVAAVEGDAARLAGFLSAGSIFFLYCPFSGERLEQLLDDLEPIARTRAIRVCSVDLPLPPRPWLTIAAPPLDDVAIYRSTLLDGGMTS